MSIPFSHGRMLEFYELSNSYNITDIKFTTITVQYHMSCTEYNNKNRDNIFIRHKHYLIDNNTKYISDRHMFRHKQSPPNGQQYIQSILNKMHCPSKHFPQKKLNKRIT